MKHENPQNLNKLDDADLSGISGGTESTASRLTCTPDEIIPRGKLIESAGIMLQPAADQSDSRFPLPTTPSKFALLG